MCSVTQQVLTILLLVWANEAWFDVICSPHVTIWCHIWKLFSDLLKKLYDQYICDTVVMVVMVVSLVLLSSHQSHLVHYLLPYQGAAARYKIVRMLVFFFMSDFIESFSFLSSFYLMNETAFMPVKASRDVFFYFFNISRTLSPFSLTYFKLSQCLYFLSGYRRGR